MSETTLIEAWSHWAHGVQVNDYVLWCVKILWWGRIGKSLEFFGALTVVIEIIGPTRLREFGRSIKLARFSEESDKKAEEGWPDKLAGALYFLIWLLLTFAVMFGLILLFPQIAEEAWSFWGWRFDVFLPIVWLISAAISLFMVDYALRPFGWILERKFLNELVKLAAALMLLIGFHFDLLAS